ncbi:MAG TPA: ComEC/Rec2 family competence protein [Candidatus Avidesulfovibrio excrementigallinarum]|nr:ComEC/Rec2 family competence protein [Candidatus Avidesulfovibrio excrementigallinarum]
MIWLDRRCGTPRAVVLLSLAVTFGFAYAAVNDRSDPPPTPEWMYDREAVSVSAVVSDTRGLPGQRIRLILDELVARDKPLPGKLVWTWDAPPQRLVPGTRVHIVLRVLPVGGFRNHGAGGDSGLYWRRQGVFWRAWSAGAVEGLTVEQPDSQAASWLERLQHSADALRESWLASYVAALNRLYPIPAKPFRYGEAPAGAPHGWGYLPALVFGDRTWLGLDDVERLTRAGLVHSIALSGQHLAVVGLLAGVVVLILQCVRPGVLLRMARLKLALLLSLPPALGYLWLGDAPPSLQRAALMLAFWTLFRLLNRPTAFPDALLAALCCLTLSDPALLADIGVQLSFGSVAGIALIAPTLSALWERPFSRTRRGAMQFCRNAVLGTLACSLAVQIATLPLVLTIFGRVPALFLLNLPWLPVLGFWVLPLALLGLVAVVAGVTPLADILLRLAAEPCFILSEVLRFLDGQGWLQSPWLPRPHWTSCLGWVLLVLAAAFALHRPRPLPRTFWRMAVAGALLLVCGPLIWLAGCASDDIRLRLLDVGQGQAVLIEGPGHHRLIVDGGGVRSARFDTGRDILRPVLTANSPLCADLVALSHPDLDHLKGLLFLADHASLRQVLLPAVVRGHTSARPLYQTFQDRLGERRIPVRLLERGDRIDIAPGFWIEVLTPDRRERQRANDGLIFRLVLHGHGLAIIPGDAEKATLNRLVRSGLPLQADILIAPHHGSRSSLSASFIRAVNPRAVLVSCGAFNRWGFPSGELRQLLASLRIPLYTTAEFGELDVLWDAALSVDARQDGLSAPGRSCTVIPYATSH